MRGGYDFSDDQQQKIRQVIISVGIISFLGALFIISIYLIYKKLRSFPLRYIFFLSTADLINTIGLLMTQQQDSLDNFAETEDKIICKVQAFLINYGELSSILWTTVIAWVLYQKIVVQRIQDYKEYEMKMFFYAYFIPLFFSLIPIMSNDYGNAGAWCWIKIREDQRWRSQVLRLFEFYLPLWIAFIYNGISMYKVYKFVKQRAQDRKENNLVNKLIFYPLILILCWSMGTIDRIFNFAGKSYFTFHIIHILLAGLQGFINAMVYGLTKKVRKAIKLSLQKYCSFFIKKDILTLKDKYIDEEYESEQNQQAIELNEQKKKQSPKFQIE